ncbi:UDP pyrophosphate phosphatase [Bacillus idriensis]|uniref:Undecaprenyl-diphosphatase n=1 Tax=Metabacillus idriensis TaxID=324768 RepID=A0A6I2M5A5_9BACI|nr:undecaprenyl-diphosphate phosphatase [Metabacillus idriensis]MRX52717.1 UDP pyrophosphate phosphatase [Metabacillus idriensis]
MDEVYLILKYFLLGLFQGFTEPIPVSSSGHLVFAQHFLGVKIEGLSFELLVNAASLIAVLLIYREDLIRLAVNGANYAVKKDPSAKKDFMFIVYLLIATIPAAVLGILFKDVLSSKNVQLAAGSLIVTGIALYLIRNLRGSKKDGDLTVKDALIIGFAQAVALIPGISRSGATIVAAMALGTKQETALRFSFLLFIPVSAGGMVLGISDLISDEYFSELLLPYTAGFIGSLIMSYFSLKWFMGIMEKGNLKYFAFYCFIIGPLVLFFA